MITPRPCAATRVARVSVRRAWPVFLFIAAAVSAHAGSLGQFTDRTDIGAPQLAGTAVHDAAKGTYTIGGGGANMWFKTDSFHYVWQKVEGDTALAADIAFPGTGGNAHRKGVLMIRQTLDHDSAYADVAFHGDGLTSLQFREAAGEVTHEVQTVIKAPKRLRIEKVGDYVYMSLAGDDGVLHPSGSSARLALKGPFYIGLGVCAHDEKAFETAVFSNVVIGQPPVATVRSSLEYVKIPSGDRVCVYPSYEELEAPAWQADGSLQYAVPLRYYRIRPEANATPQLLTNGRGVEAHSMSPDGKWMAYFKRDDSAGIPGTVVLTLQPPAGGDTRELMRLPDQERALLDISWSADSTKIAYIRHQPAAAAK